MPRSTRFAALASLVVALAGCSFTAPPLRYFEIRLTPTARLGGPVLPTILVPDFSCVAAYDHLRVVIRKSDVEVATSRNVQWTTLPGRMLAQGLRTRLESSGRFESVRREVKPNPPYVIEGVVQAIELSEHPSPMARLALHLTVRRSADGRVIDEPVVDETRPTKSRDPVDGIVALRDLYAETVDGLSARIVAAIEHDLQQSGTTH